METFKATIGNTSFYLDLNSDGDVFCSKDCSRPYHSGGWAGYLTDSNLHSCIFILDEIAKCSPEVYRKVHVNISQRTEQAYITFAQHCKTKNNELAQKFQIIE